MQLDRPIIYDNQNFLSQVFKFIENLCRFVEEENKTITVKLSGKQKYSRFLYLFNLLYKAADFYFNFPSRIDKVIEKLSEYVEIVISSLHFFNEFSRGEKV